MVVSSYRLRTLHTSGGATYEELSPPAWVLTGGLVVANADGGYVLTVAVSISSAASNISSYMSRSCARCCCRRRDRADHGTMRNLRGEFGNRVGVRVRPVCIAGTAPFRLWFSTPVFVLGNPVQAESAARRNTAQRGTARSSVSLVFLVAAARVFVKCAALTGVRKPIGVSEGLPAFQKRSAANATPRADAEHHAVAFYVYRHDMCWP